MMANATCKGCGLTFNKLDLTVDGLCSDCASAQEEAYLEDIRPRLTVTRDMALDAGDPDLEGTEY